MKAGLRVEAFRQYHPARRPDAGAGRQLVDRQVAAEFHRPSGPRGGKEAPTDLAEIAAAFRQLCGQGRAAGDVDEDDALGGHRLALDADQAGCAGERADLGPASTAERRVGEGGVQRVRYWGLE